ncbi:transglycosylase-like protein with SLT domain [Phyllobacterium myrsinacearum]|uniref:lytic transglycosylase domain-containing protein n=1 Tax=Phyllobacterium myrsinacearum TaxID=28101 RepID=UPI00102A93F2|nr:transglycosylase SLT domain-containing protein [Phyllobacterium myrsinacearum]RZS79861.1 transglycosylase-like protein with SLT domain [Phyllobacterium myrsinacearum]
MAGVQNASLAAGWQSFYADRLQRQKAATSDALRAHFQAELDLAKKTMSLMGINPGDNGAPPSKVTSPNSGSDSAKPGTGNKAGNAGTVTLGPGLHENLKPYSQAILKAAAETGVPADLLAAVIWDESKGKASAGTINGQNGQTDSGLMQINPATFASLKATYPSLLQGNNLSDPQTNIMAGALYLKEQYKTFGNWDLALRAYNSGPGSVDRSNPSASTTGLGTKNYVEKVNYFWNIISKGGELPLAGYPGGNGSF